MAEIITWLNTEPDKSGDRIIPKVRTKGVYDDKNKSLDEKMPFDFGVNEDKYGYYNSKGELIPFEKGGIKKWSELQEKPFENIGHMLGVDDKQSLYAENYIVAEWDINKKYYLNDFCMYKKKIYRRINEKIEGMDFDLAKPEAVFKTEGEFIMYPWRHNKYNSDLAYASWGYNNGNLYCLYMCSRVSPDGARTIGTNDWGHSISPEPGYVDFLGERFWINFQWFAHNSGLSHLSTREGLPQITPVNKPDGGLDNLETLKNLLYAAGVWDGTEGRVLPPDESSRWALADSQYIFDYVKTIKNDFSWSEIKEKPFASIDKNTLEVQNDELIVKKQAWDDIINKPFSDIDPNTLEVKDNILTVIGGGGGGGISELPENLVYYSNEEENIGLPSINPTMIFSDLDYSTEEQLTGRRWIDGKPIYQKTVVWEGSATRNSFHIEHGIENLETIVTANLIYKRDTEFWGDLSQDENLRYNITGTVIAITNNSWDTMTKLMATILYTKTTDTADSPIKSPTQHNYSTEEKIVGTWVDGKPVYEKVFLLYDNITNGLVLEENVKHLITQTGHWVQVEAPMEEQLFPKEYSPTQSTMVSVRENNLTLFVMGINILRCTIIVQYTKTTDIATSTESKG